MLALIAAFFRPRTGEGAAIAISETETAELAATLAGVSRRMATLESSMHSLGSGSGSNRPGGLQP
jgi:hypothetical protein